LRIEEFLNRIICGNCLEVMKEMPPESIDLVMFSPPYYGLRNYGEETETTWGGDKNCKHEWVSQVVYHDNLRFRDPNQKAQVGNNRNREIYSDPNTNASFCAKCGAWRGQLGLEPSWRMYINHLVEICREIWRVLKKTGSMYINIGDTYASSLGKHGNRTAGFSEKTMVRDDLKPPRPKDYKPKCLMGIPWRLAFALIDDGWILRNEIIWHKPNAMPSSVKDRLNVTHEKIFHFVKQRKYYYNLDAIREPHKINTLKRWESEVKSGRLFNPPSKKTKSVFGIGSISRGRTNLALAPHSKGKNPGDIVSARVKANLKHFLPRGSGGHYAYGGIDSKDGKHNHPKGKNPGDVFLKQDHVPSRNINIYKGFNARYRPREDGKNPGDFWSMSTKPFPEAHFAVYPLSLCVKPILSSCPPDGVILDPFVGSGTTCLAAELINRSLWDKLDYVPNETAKKIDWNLKWIGIDINPKYVEIAKRRLKPYISQRTLTEMLER